MPDSGKVYRFLELDVLRGFAAIAVLVHHYTARYDDFFGHMPGVPRFEVGAYGALLFFMISGFVIFMTLERTRNWLDFVVSRCSRILPAYWLAVVLTFTVISLAGLPGREVSLAVAVANISMLQEYLSIEHVDGVYWTLTIELGFYLIMLALYRARLLKRVNAVAICWLALAIGVRAISDIFNVDLPKPVKLVLLLDFAHLFIAGILTYKVWRDGFSVPRVGLLLGCVLTHWYLYDFANAILISMFLSLVMSASQGWIHWIAIRPLIFLGTISYSLYLVHQNIGYVILRASYSLGLNPYLGMFVATVVVLGVATLITFNVEKPAMRTVRQWYIRVAASSRGAVTDVGRCTQRHRTKRGSLNEAADPVRRPDCEQD